MDNVEFEKLVGEIFDRLNTTLIVKGREYSRNADRLHNFNIGSEISGQTRERVLDGFLLKHYISYRDMLNDLDKGIYPSIEYLEEKIGDILVYYILFEVSMKDKLKNKKSDGE